MHIRFFNPNDSIEYTPERPEEDYVAGPFPMDTLQVTYTDLRVGIDGDSVAFYDTERGQWRLVGDFPTDGKWHAIQERLSTAGYSDWGLSK